MTDPQKHFKGGFTLVELMIVVAIIGILAAVAVPRFATLITKSKEANTKGSMGAIRSAISIYYADMEGTFPGDDLSCLVVGNKYMGDIPTAWAPPNHNKSAIVDNNDAMGLNMIRTADDGRWKYWNWVGMATAGHDTGDFWMGCTHTDTKGVIWSSQ